MLSVKSGILGLYIGIIVYLLVFAFKRKKYSILVIGLGLTIAVVGILFYLSPSLQNKYYYTIWQIGEYSRSKWLYYSDLERLKSIEMGWEMIKLHPILGSGIGDMHSVTEKTYLEHLNHRLIKYPHNQFIYSWAFCGIFSVLSLAGIFWASFIRRGSFRIEISVAALAVIWSSFLYEHTLASQAGISLFLTISLLAWSRQKSNTI
ncbi:MAG: O-antigen ligase family protein [Saprospiraceae bacterium]|nr:O-antigen ligase family protein [Candidatus Vicinibacter affinis]